MVETDQLGEETPHMNKKTIAAGAAAVALTGTLALGGTASAADCGSSQVSTAYGCGSVSGDNEGVGTTTSSPAAGTGGLIFRDQNGNDLGSGLGERDQFEWHGDKRVVDGTVLIFVKQMTTGGGGWGSLYSGWVKAEFTQAPSIF